jgi:Dihaem cytochrome c
MTRLTGLLIAGALIASASAANALQFPKVEHAAMLKECGACHMVYAPQMLPQRSWDAMMAGLDKHFGENAQLEEPLRADILAFLLANASDSPDSTFRNNLNKGVKPDVVPARITEMPWWQRAHGEVNVARIATTKIKTAGNCIGCHAGSDKSMRFSEP